MSLEANVRSALTRIATEFKTVRTLITGTGTGNLSGLSTTQKTSLVAAINELKTITDGLVSGGGGDLLAANNLSDIADAAAALANLGGLTAAQVDSRIEAVIGAAPAALDTLIELANALGNDPNFAGTVNTALSKRVRFDAAQTLTAGEKAQALANMGASPEAHNHDAAYFTKAEIGDVTANFVTHFEAGLA